MALVIGNRPAIPHSLLAPGATLGSAIVNQFAEASPGLGTSAVIGLAGILLLLTILVNVAGTASRPQTRRPAPARCQGRGRMRTLRPAGAPDGALPDMGVAAVARRRVVVRDCARRSIRRRRMTGRAMQVICLIVVLIGVAPLIALVVATVSKGAGALSIGFLLHAPTPEGVPGGGISTAIVGSGEIVAYAVALAVPLGLFVALFLFERPGPHRLVDPLQRRRHVRRALDHHRHLRLCGLCRAVPPFLELGGRLRTRGPDAAHHGPGQRGGDANRFRRPVGGGDLAGARRLRVARSVVLRGALPGVVTGNLLALARGVGETAPLLFTVASPTFAMTLLIFNDATQPFPDAQQTAWGTALVLLALVLILSVTARTVAWTLNRKTR